MPNYGPRALGRLPSKIDPRTLRLARYLRPELPVPPAACHWETIVPTWGVAGNDRYGNCVIATAAHAILTWSANAYDDLRPITDNAVIELSRQMGALRGYNILDRLKYWAKTGMWSNTLYAYAAFEPSDESMLMVAINTFGLADIGINMPRAWMDADVWDAGHGFAYRPGSWGGHSVPLVGYDEQHVYAVTWGQVQAITYAAIHQYCDEAYACINPRWINDQGQTPSGFDLTQLREDLAAVRQ